MHGAKEVSERSKKTTIDLLREYPEKSNCVCNGVYQESVVEILESNSVNVEMFKRKVYSVLVEGRKKGNNLMIIGPANCGKTFLIRPITEIFNAFVSPASGTFAWVGAEQADVLFLNDLRWSEKLMSWPDFLNLLEGLPVHLQAPKTHYSEDILWEKRTPIFATSSSKVRKYDGGVLNDVETKMMDVRWTYIEFTKQISKPKDITPCGHCFANFILN